MAAEGKRVEREGATALLERKSGEGGWIGKRKLALLETKSGEGKAVAGRRLKLKAESVPKTARATVFCRESVKGGRFRRIRG